MPATANIRKLSLGVVIIIAMVAALVPLCMATDCTMGSSGTPAPMGLSLGNVCATGMTSIAQAAVAPGNQQSLILTLVAALGVVFVLASPRLELRALRVLAERPPPPPLDPRGVRLIV